MSKLQHLLARSELLVQRDGRVVAVISLDVDDPRAPLGRDLAEALDQRGRHSLAPVIRGNRQVIDVNLAPLLLELVELVGDEPAAHLARSNRHQRDDVFLRQLAPEIRVVRRLRGVGLGVAECLAEQSVERTREHNIGWSEPANFEVNGRRSTARHARQMVRDALP
jgi:hypothetical protein